MTPRRRFWTKDRQVYCLLAVPTFLLGLGIIYAGWNPYQYILLALFHLVYYIWRVRNQRPN